MFYQKTIADLRDKLLDTEACYNSAKEARDKYYKGWMDDAKRLKQISDELDQALESITGYEGKVEALESEAARAYSINNSLAEANRDLTYQNGLLVTVLQTLRIPVKLPARDSVCSNLWISENEARLRSKLSGFFGRDGILVSRRSNIHNLCLCVVRQIARSRNLEESRVVLYSHASRA
jgi:hypothetical protein